MADPADSVILESSVPRRALLGLVMVWGMWGVMLAVGVGEVTLHFARTREGVYLNVLLLAGAAAALLVAIRRARGRTRMADAFFPLVLLNPGLYTQHPEPLNATLVGTALLGLMAGGILAMKRDDVLRFFAVTVLALLLAAVADTFLMLLPALAAWMLFAGYHLAQSPLPRARLRGILLMALGEVNLFAFGLACFLVEPTHSPTPATLFSRIISFADFPLIVLAIVMLALGWRTPSPARGPHHTTPPYFAGILALLIGLLTMLLNNFQSGTLPPPGADQTTFVLCLLYTVFALHGPKRLQWLAPPVLLIVAVLDTIFG